MGTIQSDIGLVTGMNIGDTVTKLMALAAKPKDLLVQRQTDVKSEQTALTALTAQLASIQYIAKNLGKADLFHKQAVTSSNPATLTATVSGSPALGNYQFTPLAMVQSQQWLASGVANDTEALGGGAVTFRFGAQVEQGAELSWLNGGTGLQRGKIRITDHSGASAEIDLSNARTMDDVLSAINTNTAINVSAVADGDHLRLVDNTGLSTGSLKVQEVGGHTAASLGLDQINTSASTADGKDVLRLFSDLGLDALNDNNGVQFNTALSDIQYTLRDGTTGEIDLSPIIPGGSQVDADKTVGDVLDRINKAAAGKLRADISSDGSRLVVTDLTSGSKTFSLQAINDSKALADLGLDSSATDGVVTGRRVLGGLKTVLLSTLGGGKGLGTLGDLQLTDRSGASATVDLSHAETLQDVTDAISAAGLGISARVNAASNGIELVDTTGQSASNLIVASTDDTAENLGIAVNANVDRINSGDLHLQVISENTRLDQLNGGQGIARGSFTIVDSAGNRTTVNLANDNIHTVGDVLHEINRLASGVHAEINATGDGIAIQDLKNGTGKLTVQEGSSTTAADLHLLRDATSVTTGGQTSQVIDGTTTQTIQLAAGDTLDDLRDKINQASAGASAVILNDGSYRPYRLALTSQAAGAAGNLVVDMSGVGLTMQETARGQDALLAIGSGGAGSILLSSSSNTFSDALPGVSLAVQQASGSPVTVNVANSDTNLVANVKTMVDDYNKFRSSLTDQMAFNADTNTTSVLTGNGAALRLDQDLGYFFSGQFFGAGSIQSLAEIGISVQQDGTLQFDQSKLEDKYAADPQGVEKFFTTDQFGFAKKFDQLLEQLSGAGDNSLLTARLKALDDKSTDYQSRIDAMTAALAKQQDRLYNQFYQMEIAISKIQSSMSTVSSLAYIGPTSTTSSSSSSSIL